MPRPLMQHGVGQLEDMFGSCRGSLQALWQLKDELQYRQVPRALALLEKVQAAMSASDDTPRQTTSPTPTTPPLPPPLPLPAPAPPQQPDLWGQAPAPVAPALSLPPAPPVASVPPPQVPRPAPPIRPAQAPAAAKPDSPVAPTMPLEDAYRLLKATAGSTWESIEQIRRQLVQQAHASRVKSWSPERRASALAEARRVNAAYATLSQARCSAT